MVNRVWQAILFGCLGAFLGSSMGVAAFGDAVNGAIVFGPLGLILGWLSPFGSQPGRSLLNTKRRIGGLIRKRDEGLRRMNEVQPSSSSLSNSNPALAAPLASLIGAAVRAPKSEEDIINEILEEHLPYEITMLIETYSQIGKYDDKTLSNALIESFAIHARQLIDFFRDEQGVRASQLTATKYQPKMSIPDAIIRKLNTQIAHLTLKRARVSMEKLGPADRFSLARELLTEVQNFDGQLDQKWRLSWTNKEEWKLKAAEMMNSVFVSGPPSATGSITDITGPSS